MSSKRGKRISMPARLNRDEESDGDMEMEVEVEVDGTSTSSNQLNLKRSEESLRKSMAIDVGLRKGQRQQRLEQEFEARFQELNAQVDGRVERHQQDMRRYRDDFLTRLLALTERKADVERRIIHAVQELGRAHEMIKQEFEAILQGRSADVCEAMNTLREVEKASTRPN
ncbi:uncharacterized protein Z520_06476 [Fonsecaea multimorphosa CBS 102226]|uniref:Uncharacterized protein n=1 Tax=Fonsecaea multimorphosa CBS 102226 TaxID=1442371 RepID=A0A0D2KLX3_9EURO|nr:uncharacterized protein Z520_06476 [Fonsecaea multimorphosa CBS 102226]KIX97698.1 hypothetical protein Z520_06476 [Fonsecaea multimorphosa CBS 102226]